MKVQVVPALNNNLPGYMILIKTGKKTIGVCTSDGNAVTAYFTTKKSEAKKRAEQLREDLKNSEIEL